MPGPQPNGCAPFLVGFVGRGLDPSAAARGLAALLSFMLLVGEGFIPPVHLPIAATFSGQHLYRPCKRGVIYAFRRH